MGSGSHSPFGRKGSRSEPDTLFQLSVADCTGEVEGKGLRAGEEALKEGRAEHALFLLLEHENPKVLPPTRNTGAWGARRLNTNTNHKTVARPRFVT